MPGITARILKSLSLSCQKNDEYFCFRKWYWFSIAYCCTVQQTRRASPTVGSAVGASSSLPAATLLTQVCAVWQPSSTASGRCHLLLTKPANWTSRRESVYPTFTGRPLGFQRRAQNSMLPYAAAPQRWSWLDTYRNVSLLLHIAVEWWWLHRLFHGRRAYMHD